jgi:sugar phosphate isomerase/epimerase
VGNGSDEGRRQPPCGQAVTRRAFVERTALAACAVAWAGRGAATASGMFVSLNPSLTRTVPWPDFARLAARIGYGGVDLNLSGARTQGVDATRALFTELKIVPAVAGLPVRFSGEEAAYLQDLRSLDEVAAFLGGIGCPRMITVLPASSATPKAEFRKVIKDRLVAISEILRRARIRVGVEFLSPLHFRTRQAHEFIWRMDETLELAIECGVNVGLVLDAWHWHHAGATAADIVAAGKSRIVHVHVSDAKQQPAEEVRDNQRLMPGEGVIDLVAFFRALQQIGYEDGVSPEPLGRIPQDMSAEDGARLGLDTTLAVMKRAR